MKEDHLILGVHITDRIRHAADVQNLLTEYGCSIKTRLGLHEASEQMCSPNGILLLEICGDIGNGRELAGKLNGLEGVDVKEMHFTHP